MNSLIQAMLLHITMVLSIPTPTTNIDGAAISPAGNPAVALSSETSNLITPEMVTAEVIGTTTLRGTLKHKSWSKSTQSYCAQGSDYYVLRVITKGPLEEHVLEFKGVKMKKVQKYEGKIVFLTGTFRDKKIVNDDPYSQKPVSGMEGDDDEFNCRVFQVTKLKPQ